MTFVAEVIDKQFYSGLGLATHFSIYEIQFTRHQREAQARDQRSATDRAGIHHSRQLTFDFNIDFSLHP